MTLKKAEPGQTRIGWIGTGVMGRWMCQHLMTKGYSATVYNRTKDKAAPLLEAGAAWGDTPKAVAERSDVVFAIVGFPKDVREVFLGSSGGAGGQQGGGGAGGHDHQRAVAGAGNPRRRRRRRALSASMRPVSGGDVGAKNAALSIMIGGDAEAVEAVRPLFECMGKTIVHQGGPGAGQHTKMVNQILISGTMIGVCEALLYGYKAGLTWRRCSSRFRLGRRGARRWKCWGRASCAGNFEPGFYVEHFIKDMGIALAEAEKMHIALPGLGLVKQMYEAVRALGYGRKGTQALMLALEHLSGVKR